MTREANARRRDAITPAREDQVVLMIREWQQKHGKLTGSALARRVSSELKFNCTRQGLLKHSPIGDALDVRRLELRGERKEVIRPPEELIFRERIKYLEGELADRDAKIATYKELIIRHHENARKHDISIAQLEMPLVALTGESSGGG